jgi:2-keto-4-pentenoate hydratase
MSERAEKAAEFIAAEHGAGAVYRNLPEELRPADVAEAYQAQRAFQRMMAAGPPGPVAGRKIALASKPLQELCGVDSPIAGAIFKNDIHTSPAVIPRDAFVGLGLEFELAFTLAEPFDPQGAPYSEEQVVAAIAACRPAFELIEDRKADYSDLDARSMIADNAWCGGIVLGDPIENWRDLDLNDLDGTMFYNDEKPEVAKTGLANPIGSLVWVVNHVTGLGETVAAGEPIITGSVIKTRYPEAGDKVVYDVGGLAEVSIAVV